MINYGFSLTGKSHIDRNICCQDNYKIKKLSNGWYIAAVADGVGSAKNSQIGSKIATETVVDFCDKYMPVDYSIISIKSMLRTAYNYAYKKIVQEAEKSGEPVESYDTTLSMAIYDGRKIIYGHSGDGAIIGLNTFGDYVCITKPQKGPDGITVVPLRMGYTTWQIDIYDEELASVLLMTDGMLDIFCPYLLRTAKTSVYIPLATFFGDPLCFAGNEKEIEATKEIIKEFAKSEDKKKEKYYSILEKAYSKRLENHTDCINELKVNNYPLVLMDGVQDDKTVVGLINDEIEVDNEEESFYKEPDWQKLQDAWNRKAYPHLYANENKNVKENAEPKHTAPQVKTEAKKETVAQPDINRTATQEPQKQMQQKQPQTSQTPPKAKPASQENVFEVKQKSMQKHEKPKKKSLIDKIGDFWGV